MNNRTITALLMPALAASVLPGCFTVKTESEIKPIHITMDINLKVDKELDRTFADENLRKPSGKFAEIKEMMDRKVAGLTSDGLLVPRAGATDNDKILIAESNVRRQQRFAEIAKSSDVSITTVQKRFASQMRDRLPAGSGIWYQDTSGAWRQK